jgi:hypothetical protein
MLDLACVEQSIALIGNHASAEWHGHIAIQLLGPAYVAGIADLADGVLTEWLELVQRGWFSTKYFMLLSLLCFRKIAETGTHPQLAEVYEALLTGEFPAYPEDGDLRVFVNEIPTMPIETQGLEWLQGEERGQWILGLPD